MHQKVGYFQNKLLGIGKTCNDKPLDTKQNLGRFFRPHVSRNVKGEIIGSFNNLRLKLILALILSSSKNSPFFI